MTEKFKKIDVDASALQQYIEVLGAIGQEREGGIVRPVYSAAWVKAREQLAAWMREAGLDVRVDAVGNLLDGFVAATIVVPFSPAPTSTQSHLEANLMAHSASWRAS